MPPPPHAPIQDPDHLLPRPSEASREGGPPHRKPIGPIAGIIIIVVLLIVGAVYSWKQAVERRTQEANLPYLQSSTTTLPTIISTTTVSTTTPFGQ